MTYIYIPMGGSSSSSLEYLSISSTNSSMTGSFSSSISPCFVLLCYSEDYMDRALVPYH